MRRERQLLPNMIPLKLLIVCVLVISLVANLCMLIRTAGRAGDFRALIQEEREGALRAREVRELILSTLDKSDLLTPSSTRALILDTLLDCVVDKLTHVMERSPSNDTASGDWPLVDALSCSTVEKMNHRLQAELRAKQSVISFLSQPIINEHNFNYIHNPRNACQPEGTETLFVIPSAAGNVHYRERVRKSRRGRYVQNPANSAKLIFFLGKPPVGGENPILQHDIDEEVKKYGDIVQEDFEDTYRNIRLKAVSMLKWVSTFCGNVKSVIRTDDDVDIDPQKLAVAIKRVNQRYENFILGQRRDEWEPIRNEKHKNYMSWQEYPQTTLPPFALGALLGYPVSTVRLLYQATLRVPPIWLDDVYITGICAPKVNVPLLRDDDFDFKHQAWS